MMNRVFALSVVLIVQAAPALSYFDASAGKPAARALPMYCQMGECSVQTVEATEPVAFATNGVLFRVESQNWGAQMGSKNLRRGSDTTSYVLCSKAAPAVVDQQSPHSFTVTFLSPSDSGAYAHSNETSLALYFVVCHSRAFDNGTLFTKGPSFAASLGYAGHGRDDQPTIDAPEKVLALIAEAPKAGDFLVYDAYCSNNGGANGKCSPRTWIKTGDVSPALQHDYAQCAKREKSIDTCALGTPSPKGK